MTDEFRTPYADDALRQEHGTTTDDVKDFVRRRVLNPVEVEGITVWNFNNHVVNREALAEAADGLHRDKYIIPHQVSGIWGYMVTLIPRPIREMEILGYQQSEGRYLPFPNYYHHRDWSDDLRFRDDLTSEIRGDGAL